MSLAQARDRAGPAPSDAVLLEHGEVADAQDHLGAAAAQLIERGSKLSDIGRIAHVDRGDAGTEADPLGSARRGREHHPGILVVDLVGAVAGVVAELVRQLRRPEELLHRLLRDQLQAHLHALASLVA